jgi:hypothetical protein
MSLQDSVLDEAGFVELLGKLCGEAIHLQNNPPALVPVEDRGGSLRHALCAMRHARCCVGCPHE